MRNESEGRRSSRNNVGGILISRRSFMSGIGAAAGFGALAFSRAGSGTSRHYCCARSVGPGIPERNRQSKAVRISSGADRGCPKRAMGKGQGERGQISPGGSNPGKANALGIYAKEDRRGAKGAIGESEGGEEDGLTLLQLRRLESRRPIYSTGFCGRWEDEDTARSWRRFLLVSLKLATCVPSRRKRGNGGAL